MWLWNIYQFQTCADSDMDSFDEEDEEEVPLNIAENGRWCFWDLIFCQLNIIFYFKPLLPLTAKKISGKAGPKVAAVKSIAAPSEKQVKISEPSKDDEDDDSSESSDEVYCCYIIAEILLIGMS